VGLSLSREDMEQIGKAVPEAEVVGGRYPEAMMSTTWVHANTPPWSLGSPKSEGAKAVLFTPRTAQYTAPWSTGPSLVSHDDGHLVAS